MTTGKVELQIIGFYNSEAKAPYEAARQPLDRVLTQGVVSLNSGQMYEQALEDLEGFDRIWLIYQFHHNQNWKPKVMPPRGSDHKVGVFATRAPYRPNPLGLSCVKLLKIEGLKLFVEGADLLDGSPILDIKPYLPYADSFPDSATGWLGSPVASAISFSTQALSQLDFLEAAGLTSFRNFIWNQLEFDPLNHDKKRVIGTASDAVLAYKTWRVRFSFDNVLNQVEVHELFSGYTEQELDSSKTPEDVYKDKKLHREFEQRFKKP